MLANVHFISGLPRSGSTLLAGLLRQNPRFTAAMTSMVAVLCGTMAQKISGVNEFGVHFDDARRATMLKGIFESYYAGVAPETVVFDTNRSWTGRAAMLAALYPKSRIICCVRDIGWIIDSIECMLNKNPLQLSRIFNFQPGASVYSRVEMLMNSETGLIGQPWSSLREAWYGEEAGRLIVVPYDQLVRDPRRTLSRLYQELGEPEFTHDLENVVYEEPEYDARVGMPGLHTVKRKVQADDRAPCIPPDLFAKHAGASFWLRPELNPRHVTIIGAEVKPPSKRAAN